MAGNDQDGNQPLFRRFAEELRPRFKTHLGACIFAFLCEYEMFQELAKAQVPVVRSYEGAPVDGALICPGRISLPAQDMSPLATWEWAIAQQDVEFITIDVKSVSLNASLGALRNLDYAFTRPPSATRFKKSGPEIYLVRFDGVDDYTAVVPKAVYEAASGVSYGVNGLISGIPYIWHPYMVHNSQLRQAMQNLTNPDADYTNPTTGLTLTGFRPRRTKTPSLTPVAALPNSSMQVTRQLWESIANSTPRVTVDMNPIAPLVGDFVMRVPSTPDLLCIEHKFREWDRPMLDFDLEEDVGRRSPYSKNRMWHFLIFQTKATQAMPSRYICFARHEVDEVWAQSPPNMSEIPEPENYIFEGEGAVDRLLEKIQRQGPKAGGKVNEIVNNMEPGDSDIQSLVAGNHIARAVELSQQIMEAAALQLAEEQEYLQENCLDDGESEINLGHESENTLASGSEDQNVAGIGNVNTFVNPNGRVYHKVGGLKFNAVGLHWVCDELNQQCYERGEMVCFPLDHGHPLGNHVLVKYHWTEQDKTTFGKDRTLPIHLYSPGVKDFDAIVLRFVDFSGPFDSKSFPLWMRGHYWTRPAVKQHFMFIASTLPATSESEAGPSYMLYPSEFTTIFEQGCRDEPSGSHTGAAYFRHVLKEEERLPHPTFRYGQQQVRHRRFDTQSDFIQDDGVNPLRCVIGLQDGSIYRHLSAALHQTTSLLSIHNPQSTKATKPFRTDLLQMKVGMLWTTAWKFGLTRRMVSKKKAAMLKASRVRAAANYVDHYDASEDLRSDEEAAIGDDDADSDTEIADL